ncbi:SWI/SNF-related matrix-associated actin-dependent regulator of chromatin subfamily E member 1 [Trichinella pseudospiralis]|uniref:SWI/SNF-related matrix-associated actin-dependent regulator of chromatin subfamily E member 1 n=1 Tax=Trichinella pseudospiralis TaxID=6337 RepID=A0A0V0YDT0_TRIPS|nr:SWI/SNF-related matrix-associated actin-dependent regulator of chromatin subfamily E member 1 [Trichinella pseudospiralis]
MSWTQASSSRGGNWQRNQANNAASFFAQPSVNSHPNFRPTRIGTFSSFNDGSSGKGPKPPEKPIMPYMRYSRRMWEKVRATNPDYKFWDIGKIIGRKWRELPDGEKQIYFDEYELEKQEYEKQMKAYHNSAAFQNYLTQKNKERNEAWRSTQVESSVYVQPIDEESDEIDSNYPRYFSAERYARNQRLLGEIFSAVAVPSGNSIVTSERLHTLRSQVSSLTHHLESLRQELKLLQENHKRKKENWESGSELFCKKLKLLDEQRPVFSEEKYAEMVKNQKEHLMSSYEPDDESLDANGKAAATLDNESSSADSEQKESNLEQLENQKSDNDNDGNICSSEQCDDVLEETCEIAKEDNGKLSSEESRNEDQTPVKEEFHFDDDVPSEVKVEITGDSDQTEPIIETSETTDEANVDLKEEITRDNDDDDDDDDDAAVDAGDAGDDGDDDQNGTALNSSEDNTNVENVEETTSEIVQSISCEVAETEELPEAEKPKNENLIETETKTSEEAGSEANSNEVSDEKDQQL